MKPILHFFCITAILVLLACKTKPVAPAAHTTADPVLMMKIWNTVDSLEKKGLVSSALAEVNRIKQMALASQESGHLVKAVMYENRYLLQLEEDSAIKALLRAEEEVGAYPEPAKSVMHSMLAQWYSNYLESRLWELRSRTEYGGPAGPDIRTWGIRHFTDKISYHYTRSVEWSGLQEAKVTDYELLLTASHTTDDLRPTLYDILMHRALDFYSGASSYLTRPAYDFILHDPLAFSPARSFIGHHFPTADSTSTAWQALQWFRQLLAFRLRDSDHEGALIDADLKRLRFVYDQGVIENKEILYRQALEHLAANHKSHPESALIAYHQASLLMQQAATWPNQRTSEQHRFAYKQAAEICRTAIDRFPESYGSHLCRSLIRQIEQMSISASAESVNLPGEEFLVKLDYRNLSSLYMKVVRLPESPRRWKGETWDSEEILRRLNQLPAEKSWRQTLDDGGDHQPHSTEIAIGPFSPGHYAVLVSDMDHFDVKRSTTGTIMFTVSQLGYWLLDDRDKQTLAVITDRKSGQALQGVKVEFISHEYNTTRRRQEEVKLGEGISDKQGWVTLPVLSNKSVALRLTRDKDELYMDESYYTYRHGGREKTDPTTLFFSDRSIYRPGQKIYFKGYALEFDPTRIPTIVPNKQVEVFLYDVNGQEAGRQRLTSNAYGTFAGHFDIPSSGLTGQMSLASSYGTGRHFFQVEEYKRPKFEVTFDTLKTIARLGESVTISGRAMDYAGTPVGGAQAGYRVERVAYRPWWPGWRRSFWPMDDDRQVLATGQGYTDEQGHIPVTFLAQPKPGGDPDLMYRFEITLYITDITGESHLTTKSLVLNKQGYNVQIDLPEMSNLTRLNAVAVSVTNSDGSGIQVSGNVKASLLKGPDHHKRERLWEAPDMPSLSDADYATRFASYFAPGMDDPSAWPLDKVAGNREFNITDKGLIDLSGLLTTPGWYKLEWTLRDQQGHILEMVRYIMVYASGKTLPGFEVFRADVPDQDYAPGQQVVADLLTGLTTPPGAIRITERRTRPAVWQWQTIPVSGDKWITPDEADRGGVIVHHLIVYNNRFYRDQQMIRVPWSNKDLNVSLTTWRDKMEPGHDENWTLKVEGQKKDDILAELLLSMYDASLDAFMPHQWQMSLYPGTGSRVIVQDAGAKLVHYWGLTYHWDARHETAPARQYRDINSYGYYLAGEYYQRMYRTGKRDMMDGAVLLESAHAPAAAKDGEAAASSEPPKVPTGPDVKETQAPQPLRTALDETVFFYPQIRTDADGQLSFSFKMKDGLTRWKFQALAHTRDLAFGLTQAEVVTQKQLMVFPNPPRFFREGDTIAFQIKVTNMTDQAMSGTTRLQIVDLISDEDVSASWGISTSSKAVQIKAGGSSPSAWTLKVPVGWTRPVKYKVMATAGSFTDGEEAILPVVTNRILITESLPLPVKANETRTFIFKSMLDNRSATSSDHLFVAEMTSSPAWYAVQALPYLMEYPYECSEQIFSRVYANTLASHIAGTIPAIRQVYDAWRTTDSDALLSHLEKNKELKSALLDETPWVRDAMGESQQKKDIALLFETNRLRHESAQSLDKLRQMQMSNGGFPWFPGGRDNWYITQYIVEGFGHLQKMGVPLPAGNARDIIDRAVPYIDARMIEWYDDLKRLEAQGKIKLKDHHVSGLQVHYLYSRSFFPDIPHPAKIDEIVNYLREQYEAYWLKHNLYEQGLIALGSFRQWPQAYLSADILKSLRERTILHDELGRYWKVNGGYQWNDAPVELQSLMIELYQDMKVPQAEIDELRVWLLKQKQTTRWKSTKATASAIYALLIHPDTWLKSVGIVSVKLGGQEVIGSSTATEAGTGYAKKSWQGQDIQQNWSTITVANPNAHVAWGSVYWQYWEDIDKVKSAVDHNPLKVTRSLLIATEGDRGSVTKPAEGRKLKVGDRLIVRLTVESDRTMEFVHLKDLRASGFEPMDVLSGYKWMGGLGYYQSTKDLATHFFIDYLPRGKYVIEYPVTVAQAGQYSEGMATLQCMYAPEFGSHSAGSRVAATP